MDAVHGHGRYTSLVYPSRVHRQLGFASPSCFRNAYSGHNNYTKSALIYLQQMSRLQDEHPEVYQHFQAGLHVVRRSDRHWAGLFSDLVIQQVLMRSMKTSGGLMRTRHDRTTAIDLVALYTNLC